MSTLETRTGYGDRHHKACTCEDCGTERLVTALTSRLWTEDDPEDLDTPAPAPVVAMGRVTVPDWMTPAQRAEVYNRRALDAAVEDVFGDLDDIPEEWTR